MLFTFRPKYGLWAIGLFVIEVLIALFVHDSFVRPFVGDYLVVFLVYCFVYTFWNVHYVKAAVAVLLFSYLIEALQYFHFLQQLGLEKSKILVTLLGSSFSWYDILAYTLGFLTILLVEYRNLQVTLKQNI